MHLTYKRATIQDIDILVESRVEVLKEVNNLPKDIDISLIKEKSYEHYKNALKDETNVSILVFDDDKIVGTGAVSFYKVMPTYHNPSGTKAYIMNMYTHKDYRRNGIASKILDLLVSACKEKGVTFITLEATDMGRKLYQNYGFKSISTEMIFPNKE